MRKLFLWSAVLVSLLASVDASAISVEARGFTLCTAGIDAVTGVCLGGAVFYGRPGPNHPTGILEQAPPGWLPDWGSTYAQRWQPHNVTTVTGSTGVNWTCCMDYDPATENPANITTTFQVWAQPPGTGSYMWINATWKQFIGMDSDQNKWCASSDDFVYQGRQDLYTPSTYTALMPVARCKATYSYPPSGPPYWRGIEYWMD